jgi:hypothetical protein
MNRTKIAIYTGISIGLIVIVSYRLLRYIGLYPFVHQAGGEKESPDHKYTTRSLSIIETPYFGKDHAYYRFELREGPDKNGEFGPLLREATMEALPRQPFLMPRAEPAFSVSWSQDSSVTFSAQGVQITLKP